MKLLLFAIIAVINGIGCAAECPSFSNDKDADTWLRNVSPLYATMAKGIDGRGGYIFRSWDKPRGIVFWENGNRYIQLNPDLKGGERLSILIFEITNAYQEYNHMEIDRRTRVGVIKEPEVFALRHELVEYDGLRYHREVLSELDKILGGTPREMLTWMVNPAPTSLDGYILPLAHDYLEAQNKSGHTDHYRRYFASQSAERP